MLAERAASEGPRSTRAVEADPPIPPPPRHEVVEGEEDDGKDLLVSLLMWRRGIVFALGMSLLACAGPEPMLRSNAKVQLQGREAAKLEVIMCQQKAEAAGLKPGTGSRSSNVAAGAGLGLI